jgi:hypothetical protein
LPAQGGCAAYVEPATRTQVTAVQRRRSRTESSERIDDLDVNPVSANVTSSTDPLTATPEGITSGRKIANSRLRQPDTSSGRPITRVNKSALREPEILPDERGLRWTRPPLHSRLCVQFFEQSSCPCGISST